MELSKYQTAILQAVQQRIDTPEGKNLRGLLIEALAGTGKSFVLVEVCKILQSSGITPDRVRLVVFGKKNKSDLADENLLPEFSQEELLEVFEKLQNFPRPKLRTVLRGLVDRLGKGTVKNLLEV